MEAGARRGKREHRSYNILDLDDMRKEDIGSGRFPAAVDAAMQALRETGTLPKPPPPTVDNYIDEDSSTIGDMLDWLGVLFGFQADNIRNQREHVVLLLANHQMQHQGSDQHFLYKVDPPVVQDLRKKLLKNYLLWCSFLYIPHNLQLIRELNVIDSERELLYSCLYLLIWGESANLRFMPECLCFIFHHMAMELNNIIASRRGNYMAASYDGMFPFSYGPNGFLRKVVQPIYRAVREEAETADGGKVPHSCWRNYDDMNEYFWSGDCIDQLSWPLKVESGYLMTPKDEQYRAPPLDGGRSQEKVGKTGFVEQRSFWNVFHSFPHLWTCLILMLQAMMIVAFDGDGIPWRAVRDRDVQMALLTVFITWSGLRLLQAILDLGMEYSLTSRRTKLILIRMILKIAVSTCWTIIFYVLLERVRKQREADGGWSAQADARLYQFAQAAGVFLLPELVAAFLFPFPWARNFVERSEWRIVRVFTWWFRCRTFVGRGMHEGILEVLTYTAFWLVVLGAKFTFSYFLELRPLVEPTRQLLQTRFSGYTWHEFFANHNRFLVLLLWAPVVLVYTMDLQIWYSVFSAVVGGFIGLSSHIGEIRNVEQLKLRFPFFASAMSFNLMPQEVPRLEHVWSSARYRIVAFVKDMVVRLVLRYGLLKTAYRMFEEKSLPSQKFACIWNEIIDSFREEDLVSNAEVELLKIPDGVSDLSLPQWPAVLLANELLAAVGTAQKWQGKDDGKLWAKISKNQYRKYAVVECYESAKHLLMDRILKGHSPEHRIVGNIFDDVDRCVSRGAFCITYNLKELEEVRSRMVALVEILLKKPADDDMNTVVSALQNLYDVVIRDLPKERFYAESVRRGVHGPGDATDGGDSLSDDKLLFVRAVTLPSQDDEAFFRRLRRLHTILVTRNPMDMVPKNLDARRRIAFFSNSLFMNMPRAPPLEKMLAFSVLTPYYSEDVSYTKEQLRTPNEDGVTVLFYLQSVFPDEWENFLERMKCSEDKIWSDRGMARELRMWASYRGQTLARTVRGMMYYQRALETLAALEKASLPSHLKDPDVQAASRELPRLKFTYVVACQIYGVQKAKKDSKADEILYLMRMNPGLRVAYVDEVATGEEKRYYSVLVKYDSALKKEVEIYRIQLPGPLKLGEGKPENQNHAFIFTRGDAVQAIDMNQDHNFEEALKVRNLLQEFGRVHGSKTPQILGIREHVLTGPVSSVAHFMSSQEMSFVTLGQRVLANPLRIRMHYGHPDFFDRLWFLTRGGISKASRVINISEDIFAGFNCTLRGGSVTHHEYIQVGKGRDVGLNQISLFEAKVASGNGEQMLSRDVYRLGHHLDFFRMLSFYHSSVGFYINNLIIVLSAYAFLWGRVYISLSGLEDSVAGSLNSGALLASINQQFIVQVGVFSALPMLVENCLERGFSGAMWDFIVMQLELCSMFFTFSVGTKCHYFGRTLLHGGAKYRATGRGFVLRREMFAENYRLYARSHFQKGIELIILLIIYASYGSTASGMLVYVLATFSTWFMAFTWIMAPFLFNPTGFDWLQTVYDFEDFSNWLWYKGGALVKAEQSWEVWWNEEHDHLRTTDFWGKVLEVVLSLRFFLIQYGLVYRLHIAANSRSILVYFVSWIYIVAAMAIYLGLASAAEKYGATMHLRYRGIQLLVVLGIAFVTVMLVELSEFKLSDIFLSSLAFLPTGWGVMSICLVVEPFLARTRVWPMVVTLARLYDLVMGILVLSPMALLSWLPGFQSMQNRLLFNLAFSKGLLISRLLTGKRPDNKTV